MKTLHPNLEKFMDKDRLELIGRIAVSIAHDIKNPLGKLRMGIDYLHQSAARASDKNTSFVLGSMKEAWETIDTILRELLDLANAQKIRARHENVNAVRDQALLLVKEELIQNDIAVVKDYGHEMPQVPMEGEKIERILANLFTNAIQAMPAGGTLQLKTYTETLARVGKRVGRRKEDVFKPGEKVVIVEVEDTGMGVPKEILKRAFQPFVTSKSASGGIGLGLAITAWIMDLHQGTAEIGNNPDGGAKVTLRFKT